MEKQRLRRQLDLLSSDAQERERLRLEEEARRKAEAEAREQAARDALEAQRPAVVAIRQPSWMGRADSR